MKRLIGIVLTLAMVISLSTNVFAKTEYKDIGNHWAKDVIEEWSEHGVINGYDGYFSPDRSMTRGEFAVVLDRIMKYKDAAENTFTDLDDNFYTEAILKLNKAEVIKGDGSTVRPKGILTREEAAVMLCRAFGFYGDGDSAQTFADSQDISYWALLYITTMVNKGLINGYENNMLLPKKAITRAEVIKILDNAIIPVLKPGKLENIKTDKLVIIASGDVTISGCEFLEDVKILDSVESGDIIINKSKFEKLVTYSGNRTKFIKVSKDSTIFDSAFMKNGAVVDESKVPAIGGGTGSTGGNSGSGTGGNSGGSNSGSGTGGNNSGSNGGTGTGGDNNGDNSGTGTEDENNGTNGGTDNEPEQTPDEPENPQPEEPEVFDNTEMLGRLQIVQDDLALYLNPDDAQHYSFFYSEERALLTIIKVCIDKTILVGNTKEITGNFIKTEYADEIAIARAMYAEMEAEGTAGTFGEKIANSEFDVETLFWLADAFGISY